MPLRALVPAAPLLGLLVWLGVVPSPVRTVAPAEAQSCSSPAFWNPFAPGGGRCEVYMCAAGFTQSGNGCLLNGSFAAYAASCPVGWGVRAVDLGIHGYQMRCVDPSPPPPRSVVDYTDDLVRALIRIGESDRSIVVEAPRSRESSSPVSFVHPGAEVLTETMRSGVRLRTAEPLDAWLHGAFEKERLPIVLTPFHPRGLVPLTVRFGLIEVETDAGPGVVSAAASAEPHLRFGPAEGCEVEADRVLCTGGASEVIGEEVADPW